MNPATFYDLSVQTLRCLTVAVAIRAADAGETMKGEKATYSRLFGGPFKGHNDIALIQLSERIRDDPQGVNRAGRERGGDLAPSGLVYFGQFIDHDMTRDETTLAHAAKPPEQRTNIRTPELDLDSLYGDGPSGSPKLYDNSPREKARFRLGPTQACRRDDTNEELPSTMDDLPRTKGVVDLADDRNNENLILAQLHVVFLQFHNRALDCFLSGLIPDADRYGDKPFEQARRFVTWHYQYLVLSEFLHRMVLDDVWDKRSDQTWRLFKPKTGESVALPVEFTQAAFRFGHSMVQENYSLQAHGVTPLSDLILKTRPGEPSPVLRADQVIDWSQFVNQGGNRNVAQNIDTLVTNAMYDLPQTAFAVFWGTNLVHVDIPLPAITLVRGSRLEFPSGQQACAAYKIDPMGSDKVAFNEETRRFLEKNDMLERTPLWYYILREAEVLGVKRFQGGECLGPLGSRIVMDVLLGVLNADLDSYIIKEPTWSPPEFSCRGSNERWQITSLKKLVRFAKTCKE